MKRQIVTFGACVVLLALIQNGGWTQTKYVPKENEELYGTWVNERGLPQKEVVVPEKWVEYNRSSDLDPFYVGTWEILAKWTDPDGNIWYKSLVTITGGDGGVVGMKRTELSRLNKAGTVWERTWSWLRTEQDSQAPVFPSEIDPKASGYGIFSRSE